MSIRNDIDAARITAADAEPQNWFTLGRDGNQTYYSPLATIAGALAVERPAIVSYVVAADEMPDVPHIELDLAAHYDVAKIQEAVIAVSVRSWSASLREHCRCSSWFCSAAIPTRRQPPPPA